MSKYNLDKQNNILNTPYQTKGYYTAQGEYTINNNSINESLNISSETTKIHKLTDDSDIESFSSIDSKHKCAYNEELLKHIHKCTICKNEVVKLLKINENRLSNYVDNLSPELKEFIIISVIGILVILLLDFILRIRL